MSEIAINICPTCGSRRIHRVKRSIESRRGGKPFVAQGIEVEECPDCGERLFSPEALQEIAAQRSRQRKTPRQRKSA